MILKTLHAHVAIVLLSFFAHVASAQQNLDLQVKAFEEKYSVELVLKGFDFGSEPKVMGADADKEKIDEYLPIFLAEFNLYPAEFIKKIGLRKIVLCKQLAFDGQKRSAYPGFVSKILCYDVESGSYNEMYRRSVVHHEFFHLIDYVDDGKVYVDKQWASLNSKDFAYGFSGKRVQGDKTQSLTFNKPGFMNKYSTQGVEEDKAEIFSYLVVSPDLMRPRIQSDPIVAAKVRMMKHLLASYSQTIDDSFWKAAGNVERKGDRGTLPATRPPVLKKRSGTIGSGTTKTPWYVVETGVPGPTILVIGGVHGNEPAGFRAADQIRHWPIETGTLVVLPRLNRLGLEANIRWTPDFRNDRKLRDLNRNFPTKESRTPKTPLAESAWGFVKKHKPDWVFDLHEGFDFHRINSKSVGSSVISFPSEADIARSLVKTVNADIKADLHFDLLATKGPVNGSLARACAEQLGARSFIFETTFKGQPISTRTRQHRLLVSTMLQRIGVTNKSYVDRVAPQKSTTYTRVGVFDGEGANETNFAKLFDANDEFYFAHLGPSDLKPEVIKQFDVLLFPGGSGSKQGKAIGEQGREHIRKFCREGGGVIGVCAGAYLCTSAYSWSLDLVNANVLNKSVEVPGKGKKSLWYRGPATNVDVEITLAAKEIVGSIGMHSVRYQNGPIISPGNHADLPAYEPLAFFRSENGIYEQQKGTMIGAPAIVRSEYGKGIVLAISPHFESTKGLEGSILKSIEHVSGD